MSQRHERIKRPPRREAFSYTFHIHVVQSGIAADLEGEGVFLHAHLQQVETYAVFVPAVEDVAYQQADDEGLVDFQPEGQGRLFGHGEETAQLLLQAVQVGARDC